MGHPSQVEPGTATGFARVTTNQHRLRSLLQAGNLTVLPPDTTRDPAGAGASILPASLCPVAEPCQTPAVIRTFVPEGASAVVYAECVPVPRINKVATSVVQGLANDTTYRAMIITTDLAGHQAEWAALVHTQDLTPPLLTVQTQPPPGFTAFDLGVVLNEAGTVYALLLRAGAAGPILPQASCPPAKQVGTLVSMAAAGGLGCVEHVRYC